MEAWGLGLFMVSAGLFATLLEHPAFPVREAIGNGLLRRIPMGLAMGLTAIAIIYSPWGQRSGAHINPAVTLTFYRLGKIHKSDAFFYVLFQFLGGLSGLLLIGLIMGPWLAHPNVKYVATVPGHSGVGIAFMAEAVMAFGLMTMILWTTNRAKLASLTGIFAGIFVASYIILEAPYSGMSINPARTFASAVPARVWTAFWLYMTAPALGMLLAAELYVRTRGLQKVYCAKLHHRNTKRCIFHCRYGDMSA